MSALISHIFFIPEAFADQVFAIWWEQIPTKPGLYLYFATVWETQWLTENLPQVKGLPLLLPTPVELDNLQNYFSDTYSMVSMDSAQTEGLSILALWRNYEYFTTNRLLIVLGNTPEPISGEGLGLPFVNSYIRSLRQTHDDWSMQMRPKVA